MSQRERADTLNGAIQYTLYRAEHYDSFDAVQWLSYWNEGDEQADTAFKQWMKDNPG